MLRGEGAYTDETYLLDLTNRRPSARISFKGIKDTRDTNTSLGTDTTFFATHGFPGAGGSPLNASFEVYYRETDDYDFNAILRPVSEEDQWRATYVFSCFFLHGSLLGV